MSPTTVRPLPVALAFLAACFVSFAPAASAGSAVKDDEQVLLFTTAAVQDGDSWVVPIHGWVFEPERDSLWRRGLVKSLLKALDIEREALDKPFIRERLAWFMVDNERGKKVTVRINGRSITTDRSGRDGHVRAVLRLPREGTAASGEVTARVLLPKGDPREFSGTVQLIPPRGYSVISDIDDTVKVTGVRDKKLLLENTFLRPFRAVDGMPELYQGWANSGVVFHYVSAGPWHLYPLLSRFFERVGLPAGTFSMREFRVKDRRITELLKSPRNYKQNAIEAILARYPRRKFILVGDAWELDPEIYASVARRRPKQVAHILIRRGDDDGFTKARERKLKKALRTPMAVFTSPEHLPAELKAGRF